MIVVLVVVCVHGRRDAAQLGHDFGQAADHVQLGLGWSGRVRVDEQIDGHRHLTGMVLVVLVMQVVAVAAVVVVVLVVMRDG